MVELLCSLLRTASTWHFLLFICLVDLVFLTLHISQPDSAALSEDQREQLRQVMILQQEVSKSIEDNSQRLQQTLEQVRLRTESLKLISQGVDGLERRVSLLKALRDKGS